MGPPPFDGLRQRSASGFAAGGVLGQGNAMPLVTPASGSGLQENGPNGGTGNASQFAGISDAWFTAQHFNDVSSYNPNYMIAPHVTHEFNLLNELLHNGLLDDSNLTGDESRQLAALGQANQPDMLSGFGGNPGLSSSSPAPSTGRSGSLMPPPPKDGRGNKKGTNSTSDKTREYYLQAADPSGNDNADERMARVLQAKYDAGLLKPFNYINGYARLGKYLDGHIAASSKQKILRTINQFRPKFREKAQGLTDMQLVIVEMWFEKQLMDYDRVFASMAVPACCWRRTGEIFRGNKEMAELINVPVDQLRDGKIALHEILTEESMVRYWEEFGTIAFDPAHDTLLTACSLKPPSDVSDPPVLKCCFSFTIRRDDHKLVKKVDDVVDLLDSLHAQLTSRSFDHATLEPFFAALQSAIHLVHLWLAKPSSLDTSTRPNDFQGLCQKLWNLCVRSRRTWAAQGCEEKRGKANSALMSVWLLSFLCLELDQVCFSRPGDGATEAAYIMGLMAPVVKASINDLNFETARLALQRGAAHLDNLKLAAAAPGDKASTQDKTPFNLQAKYYAMRIWLSWKEGCLDVAEHMYSKTDASHEVLDVDSVEFLADMIQRVGSALISRNTIDLGLTWLRRAHSILCPRASTLTTQGQNLYLAICNDLIACLLPGSPFENLEEAQSIIQQSQTVFGDNPILCHWWLRANDFEQGGLCDEDQYSEALQRLILAIESRDNLLPLVWNHVKSLRRRSPARAANLLTQFLLEPDLPHRNTHYIGKILFLRISIMSDKTTHDEECDDLSDVIDRIHDQLQTTMPLFAVELCHSSIWEMTKSASTLDHVDLVYFWCELALRPLFRNSAVRGMDRFFRKLLVCGMRRNELHISDYETDAIPSFCGDDLSLTHYLSFKAASLS
ncbi:hypothetical protein E4U41_000875 [Claviceps citrina]|nr:hypothetical protein E4U41_000875 [Claviceps citrina]